MKDLLLAGAIFMTAAISAGGHEGGRVSYFRTMIVQGPGILPGDLTCIFCSVIVARGGVRGDVVTIGGDIDISGSVGGDAVAVGGMVRVRTGARAGGELFAMGGSVEREPGAHTAEGKVPESYAWIHVPGQWHVGWRGALAVLGLYSILVALVTLVLRPRRIRVIAEAVTSHRLLAGVLGLLLSIFFIFVLYETGRLGRWEDAADIFLLALGGVLFAVGTGGIAHAVGELTPAHSSIGSLAMGVATLVLLQLIPVAGAVVFLLMLMESLGGAVWSGLGFRGGAAPKT